MGKSTISMAMFHCYVSSPEGKLAHNYNEWEIIVDNKNHHYQCTIPNAMSTSASRHHLWDCNILQPSNHGRFMAARVFSTKIPGQSAAEYYPNVSIIEKPTHKDLYSHSM